MLSSSTELRYTQYMKHVGWCQRRLDNKYINHIKKTINPLFCFKINVDLF